MLSTGVDTILNVRLEDAGYSVTYCSRKLEPKEKQVATELENLSLVNSIQYFNQYPLVKPFIAETDHKGMFCA